jgi:hypothetical protein
MRDLRNPWVFHWFRSGSPIRGGSKRSCLNDLAQAASFLNNVNDQILDLYPAHNILPRAGIPILCWLPAQIRGPTVDVYPGVGETLQGSPRRSLPMPFLGV